MNGGKEKAVVTVQLGLRLGLTAKEMADVELVWTTLSPGTPLNPGTLRMFFEGLVQHSIKEFLEVIAWRAAKTRREERERSLAE